MRETGKINYVELPSRDLDVTKRFFASAFGWSFVDYGPEYVAIENAGLDGGFFKSDKVATTSNGSALIVLYSADLEATLEKVTSSGGAIVQDIFSFPGCRRFHFSDPNGNEYAVYVGNLPWSCDWKMLKDSFTSVFPDVVYADVATQGGAPGARSYGWGTVRFSSKQSRDNAIQRFNGKNMGGRNIEVRVDRGKSNNNNNFN